MFSLILFVVLFFLSFFGTYKAMPHSMRKLEENGYLAVDMYKEDRPKIPTNAGIIVLFVSYISVALLPMSARILNRFNPSQISLGDMNEINLALMLVISIYALYGLVDDLVDIDRKLKLFLPIIFGYPLVSIIDPKILGIPFYGDIDLTVLIYDSVSLSDIFRVTIIPIYVMVVSNLVNMHSGFNGLQSGLSIIILSTLIIKSWFDGTLTNIIPVGAFLGSMIVLWWYNKMPAKVFEGNIGSMLFGSLIGCVIVIQEYWWFGFFILIPHISNFLLWILYLYKIRIDPKRYTIPSKGHKKFGYVDKSGNLFVPNNLTLKWFPNYYYKMNEAESVKLLYLSTLIFCILGLIISNT